MPVSRESTPIVIPNNVVPDEVKKYTPPEAKSLPTGRIDRATMCACKAGEDNPY